MLFVCVWRMDFCLPRIMEHVKNKQRIPREKANTLGCNRTFEIN